MGHPDFQSYANWRGPIIASQTAFPLSPANPFHVETVVTNYASLFLRVTGAAFNGIPALIVCMFYTDSTKAIQLDSFVWQTTFNAELSVLVPVLGNYMTLDITTTTAGPTNTRITCIPQNLAPTSCSYTPAGSEAIGQNVLVAASTELDAIMPVIREGRISAYVRDTAGSAKFNINLNELDQTGAVISEFASLPLLAAPATIEALGGTNPIRLRIFNTDGAAGHTVNYRLIGDGRR